MKVLETALGAVFAPTRFSLVRISVRDLVAGGKSLLRKSGVGGGGQILILNNVRRVKSTPDPDKYRDAPPISIAILFQSMPSSWQKIADTPPICITIRLPFVLLYFCKSIGVRGRSNTPQNVIDKADLLILHPALEVFNNVLGIFPRLCSLIMEVASSNRQVPEPRS